jgi:beta-glucosidase
MQGRTYRYFSGEPLYPFGYGLTYTTFAFSNLTFDRTSVGANDDLTATVDVKNTGRVTSDEVIQVYLTHPGVSGAPARALAGLRRIHLQAGESKSVSIPIANRDLSVVGDDGTRKIVPGDLHVWVGDGQPVMRTGLKKAAGVNGIVSIRDGTILPR